MPKCYHCLRPDAVVTNGVPLCKPCRPEPKAIDLDEVTVLYQSTKSQTKPTQWDPMPSYPKVALKKFTDSFLGSHQTADPNVPPTGSVPPASITPGIVAPSAKILPGSYTIDKSDIPYLLKGDTLRVRCYSCDAWRRIKLEGPNPQNYGNFWRMKLLGPEEFMNMHAGMLCPLSNPSNLQNTYDIESFIHDKRMTTDV